MKKTNRQPSQSQKTNPISLTLASDDSLDLLVSKFLGENPVHSVNPKCELDLDQIYEAYSDRVVFSSRNLVEGTSAANLNTFGGLCIRYSEKVIILHQRCTEVYSSDPDESVRVARMLKKRFQHKKQPKEDPHFHILSSNHLGNSTRKVKLSEHIAMTEEELEMHYGKSFPNFDKELREVMVKKNRGLIIFEGPPGTGKTTYLRNLVGSIQPTHDFYFFPLPLFSLLTEPNMVDFWIDRVQSMDSEGKRRKPVAILEDADEILTERNSGNQSSLSALLNITDGFLGDYLQLQIICTVNTPLTSLDPALARPGRLLAHRKFDKLTHDQAVRLAHSMDFKLIKKESYTLADIYCSSIANGNLLTEKHPIGFNLV